MELLAAVEALRPLSTGSVIELRSDSEYLINRFLPLRKLHFDHLRQRHKVSKLLHNLRFR